MNPSTWVLHKFTRSSKRFRVHVSLSKQIIKQISPTVTTAAPAAVIVVAVVASKQSLTWIRIEQQTTLTASL